MDVQEIERINQNLEGRDSQEIFTWATERFDDRLVFANSFGAEDVVIVDLLSKVAPKTKIITLDTGRLPEETYRLMDRINARYGMDTKIYFPDTAEVEELVNKKGLHSFRESLENRKECCRIRKIEPLKRALKGSEAWITGLRREQSVTRTGAAVVEDDPVFGMIKVNPLIDWSLEDVWHYIRQNEVPYNELHDKGYPSIGCEPCTRKVRQGEDPRAGRWWWEAPECKECGLHKARSK